MKISVLGIQPKYFIRPKNTDWRHSFLLEKAFSRARDKGHNEIVFELRSSALSCIAMNARHLQRPLSRYLPFINKDPHLFVPLFGADKLSNFDVIYSYDCFPNNSGKPVIWHNGPTDTALLSKRGVSVERIHKELEWKAICADKAALIAVSSDTARSAFDQQFPGHHHKTLVLPFILPGVVPLSKQDIVAKHRGTDRLNILFVGRESRRKGLDLVIAAFDRLQSSISSSVLLTLTIVSSLADGTLAIPKSKNVVWHKELDHAAVQELMKQAHIFVMPSREESYGLVFVEAMAAGAVPIAPAREPQISLLGNGSRGVLCDVSSEGVFAALLGLIENRQGREEMALNGLDEFRDTLSPDSVLAQYEQAFVRATQ